MSAEVQSVLVSPELLQKTSIGGQVSKGGLAKSPTSAGGRLFPMLHAAVAVLVDLVIRNLPSSTLAQFRLRSGCERPLADWGRALTIWSVFDRVSDSRPMPHSKKC